MPGPIFVPGAKNTSRPAPPKPVAKPWISVPKLAAPSLAPIPPEPLAAWRSLWHAIGFNLPWYINQSRATRRALRAFGVTHG